MKDSDSGKPHFLPQLAFVAASGAGVTLLFWHAATLRLHPGGVDLAWPVVAAVGMGWLLRGRSLVWTGSSLLIGALAGVLGVYGSLQLLPITALGTGIGLGVVASALALMVVGSGGRLVGGALLISFATAVGASQLVGLDATTGAADVLAVFTTLGFGFALGLLGAEVEAAVRHRRVPQVEILPQPALVGGTPDDTLVLEPVGAPLIEAVDPSEGRPTRNRLRTARPRTFRKSHEEQFGPLLKPPAPDGSEAKAAR